MAYRHDTWTFPNSIDHEYKYMGNYGAKGDKRAKKRKATEEQIKKQNQRNKEKRVWRKIRANFKEGDYWNTLKYQEGTRKPLEEVYKDLKRCLDHVREDYKKLGEVFKYIYRIEIGKRGGIHIHLLCNRINGKDSDLILKKRWNCGTIHFQTLYEVGGYKRLANYLTKQLKEEEYEQLSLFEEQEKKKLMKYSCSRNLVEPKAESKLYTHWTMRKILKNGPVPTKGFYIDENSIVHGINPYTGMSYYHYTEYRIETRKLERSHT